MDGWIDRSIPHPQCQNRQKCRRGPLHVVTAQRSQDEDRLPMSLQLLTILSIFSCDRPSIGASVRIISQSLLPSAFIWNPSVSKYVIFGSALSFVVRSIQSTRLSTGLSTTSRDSRLHVYLQFRFSSSDKWRSKLASRHCHRNSRLPRCLERLKQLPFQCTCHVSRLLSYFERNVTTRAR